MAPAGSSSHIDQVRNQRREVGISSFSLQAAAVRCHRSGDGLRGLPGGIVREGHVSNSRQQVAPTSTGSAEGHGGAVDPEQNCVTITGIDRV